MQTRNIFLIFVGVFASAIASENNDLDAGDECLSVMRELIETGHAPDYVGSSKKIKELEAEIELLREGACYVGATSKRIPDFRVSASSAHGHCLIPFMYIHSPTAWCASAPRSGSWVQFDLTSPRKITGVVTRGRQNAAQWVRTYTVEYGNSISSLQPVLEKGVTKVFQANIDQYAFVRNFFPEPVLARFIRIYPKTWNHWPSMRMDLLDC